MLCRSKMQQAAQEACSKIWDGVQLQRTETCFCEVHSVIQDLWA